MTRFILFLSFFLFVAIIATAKSPQETFDAARADFESDNFADAKSKFEELANAHPTAELLFNTGNCAYRLGNPGEAILWYRRALIANPRHNESIQNQGVLEKQLGSRRLLPTSRVEFLKRSEWITWATVFFWIAVLAFVIGKRFFRAGSTLRILLFLGSITSLLLAITFTICVFLRNKTEDVQKTWIVLPRSGVAAHTAPARSASKIASLTTASEVLAIEVRGTWIYCMLPVKEGENYLRGWVSRADLGQLWPYPPEFID